MYILSRSTKQVIDSQKFKKMIFSVVFLFSYSSRKGTIKKTNILLRQ